MFSKHKLYMPVHPLWHQAGPLADTMLFLSILSRGTSGLQVESKARPNTQFTLFTLIFSIGHTVAQIKVIFRAIPPRHSPALPALDKFLAYVHFYENVEVKQRLEDDEYMQFARWLYLQGEMNENGQA